MSVIDIDSQSSTNQINENNDFWENFDVVTV